MYRTVFVGIAQVSSLTLLSTFRWKEKKKRFFTKCRINVPFLTLTIVIIVLRAFMYSCNTLFRSEISQYLNSALTIVLCAKCHVFTKDKPWKFTCWANQNVIDRNSSWWNVVNSKTEAKERVSNQFLPNQLVCIIPNILASLVNVTKCDW